MTNTPVNRRVLWADDDADYTLESIARLLRRRGNLSLIIAEDFNKAVEALNKAVMDGPNDRFTSLIVDTILPPGISNATLGDYLGMKLAELAVGSHKLNSVVFLSVVPYAEVADHFNALKARHSGVLFEYFNKLALFDRKHVDDLLASLR